MRPPHVQKIFDALVGLRPRFTSEAALQAAIATLLTHARITAIPEHRLGLSPGSPAPSPGRIDFDVQCDHQGPRVGIEVKVDGGEMEHLRQLYRYAPFYDDLVLITTKASCPGDQILTTREVAALPTSPAPPTLPVDHECRLHVLKLFIRF